MRIVNLMKLSFLILKYFIKDGEKLIAKLNKNKIIY